MGIRRIVRGFVLACTLCALASSAAPALAQSGTTTLESAGIGDRVTIALDVPSRLAEREEGFDGQPNVATLCVPSCTFGTEPSVSVQIPSGGFDSVTLQDGASLWELSEGDCGFPAGPTCSIFVSYTAGDAAEHPAEVFVGYDVLSDAFILPSFSLRGTLGADPGQLVIAEDRYEVREGERVTIPVERVGGADGELTASLGFLDQGNDIADAASAGDYRVVAPADGSFRWGDGDRTSRSIVIEAVADTLSESLELTTLILDSDVPVVDPQGNVLGFEGADTLLFLVDVPPPAVPGVIRFDPAEYTVAENDGPVSLTLTREDGTDGIAVVDYRLVDGTATFGEDYGLGGQGASGRVVWDDGEGGPKSIPIAISEDDVAGEGTETFTVVLSVPPGIDGSTVALGDDDVAMVVIEDTTRVPDTIALARATEEVAEDAGTLEVIVRRAGGGVGAASVAYRVVPGSASPTSDYAIDAPEGRVSWPAGDREDRVIGIRIVDDSSPEVTETFSVVLEDPRNATLGEPASSGITIVDDDPAGVIGFDPVRYAVNETDGRVVLTVSRTEGDAGPASVRWNASDVTARAGSDYAASAGAVREGTLSWPAGDGSARTITLDIADDGLAEPEESFEVVLSDAVGAGLGASDGATVLIGDAPVAELDRLRFAEAGTRVDENGGSAELVVQRVGTGAGRASVRYTVTAGTASPENDLDPDAVLEGLLTWEIDDTEDRVIAFPILDDDVVEEDERFTVTLSAPEGAALGSPTSNEVTIVNDDVAPELASGTLRFIDASRRVNESDGEVRFGVERVGGTDGAVSVRYATADADAVAGSDFRAADGILSWADGEDGQRFFTVVIESDTLAEDDERFLVRLSDPVGLDAELSPDARELAVTIEEASGPGSIVVLSDTVSVDESEGRAIVRVSRQGGSEGPLRVRYRTVADSAVSPDDFTAVDDVLEWADGESGERELVVPIVDDDAREGAETFFLRLSDVPPAGTGVLAGGEVRIVIRASDLPEDMPPGGSLRLVIVSGEEQSGLPGDTLEPMSAQVLDGARDDAPSPGARVRWRAFPAGSAELLDGDVTESAADGRVSNRVRILSRGFLSVVAAIEDDDAMGGGDASEAGSPPLDAGPGEAVFLVRAGFAVAAELSPNQSEAGRALDAACDALDDQGGLTSDQQDLLGTCRELEARLADGRLPAALDRLAHEELLAIGDSIIETTDIQVTNVYARINAIRAGRRGELDLSGLDLDVYGERIPGAVVEAAKGAWTGGGASADGSEIGSRLGVFANGTVSVGEVDGNGNQADADLRTSGLTIGADYRFGANTVLGIGFGVVDGVSDFTSDGGGVDLSGFNLTLFGTWYAPESGYLDGVVDIGRNRYDVRRRINLPGLPDRFGVGETDADVVALTFGAGRDFAFGAVELGPYARVSLIHAAVDGYAERASGDGVGSGSVLDIDAHDIDATRVALGGQVSRTIGTRRGVLVPQLRLELEVDAGGDPDGIDARFRHDPSGTPFTVRGNPRDGQYLNLGLGGSAVFAGGRSGFLFYESRLQHDYITQHWLKAGLRLEF